VQVYVSELRRALAPDALDRRAATVVTSSGGYVLAVPKESVDIHRFERLSDQGRRELTGGDAHGAVHTPGPHSISGGASPSRT
jgi:hypothetical protein